MSAEDVQDLVDDALGMVVANNVDLDEAERILEDAQGRIEELRTLRGEA